MQSDAQLFFVNESGEGGLFCPRQALISPAGAAVPPDTPDHDPGQQAHGRDGHRRGGADGLR